MSRSKPGKFPEKLFVTREEDSNKDHWYNAQEQKDEHAEVGETVLVAEYRRVRVIKLTAITKEEKI